MVQTLWKTLWRILNTLKIELPHDSAISLLGIYLKKIKTLNGKYIYTPVFIGALFIAAKIQKQVECPSVDKQKIIQLLKKKEILPFVTTWIALRDTMLIEMSDKERQTPNDLTYLWDLKKK